MLLLQALQNKIVTYVQKNDLLDFNYQKIQKQQKQPIFHTSQIQKQEIWQIPKLKNQIKSNKDLICQQHDPAKILIYIINYKDNLELKQEIALKQFQFDYCGAFPIISLESRYFLKNYNCLVVLSQTESNNYVIEQVIDKSFSCGCVDSIGGYLHLVNENEQKLETYNIY